MAGLTFQITFHLKTILIQTLRKCAKRTGWMGETPRPSILLSASLSQSCYSVALNIMEIFLGVPT